MCSCRRIELFYESVFGAMFFGLWFFVMNHYFNNYLRIVNFFKGDSGSHHFVLWVGLVLFTLMFPATIVAHLDDPKYVGVKKKVHENSLFFMSLAVMTYGATTYDGVMSSFSDHIKPFLIIVSIIIGGYFVFRKFYSDPEEFYYGRIFSGFITLLGCMVMIVAVYP